MSRGTLAFVLAGTLALTAPGPLYAQEPTTRAEALRREREEKSRNMAPLSGCPACPAEGDVA